MTIRTRLSLWYAVVLTASLLIIGLGAYREIIEQLRNKHLDQPVRVALLETGELIFQVGLPAVMLGLAGGWWLTRRALAPLAALTRAAEQINEGNLTVPLPRSHNGDELDRLTEVLNAMTARLHTSFNHIREFTLHASHELKTPLTVMHGELEIALCEENLPPAQREHLLSQLDEVQRLSKIVNALTLLAKADAGQVQLRDEPVPFDELVREVFADAQMLARSSGLELELAACDGVVVRGDRHRFRQLLLNLADNAVKYNEPGGRVILSLTQMGGIAEFVITNTGPGIAPEIAPRLFDRFFRGDPAHGRADEGCGLGLAIARWIVSAHKGTINITSEPAKLTTVTVRLPVARATKSR